MQRIGQSRQHSALESVLNILIGVTVAYFANMLILPEFGFEITHQQNVVLTVVYTIISFLRSYFVRRLFNKLHLMDIL
jgi:K+-sensing histidine kinase KdpD